MPRALLLVIAAAVAASGCDSSVRPSDFQSSYFLSEVDGKALPVIYSSDGTELLAGSLSFQDSGRPRPGEASFGRVSYSLTLRPPGQADQLFTIDLDYAIENTELHINLCPPGALCIASDELVGELVGSTRQLLLTRYTGGVAGSTYLFFPTLPD